MIKRPEGVGAFQFVILSALRAAQLTRGCTPRVDGTQKLIMTAQREVAEGKVLQDFSVVVIDVPLVPAPVVVP